MRSTILPLGLLVTGAFVACEDTAETGRGQPESRARAAETVDIRDVDLGRSVDIYGAVVDKSSSFDADDTIIASVDLEGLTPGASVVATWKDAQGNVVQKDIFTVEAEGVNRTKFTLNKVGGLASGEYDVEITATGGDSSVHRFTIKDGGTALSPDGGREQRGAPPTTGPAPGSGAPDGDAPSETPSDAPSDAPGGGSPGPDDDAPGGEPIRR